MPPKIVSKVVCEMWNNSYQVDLALRPTEYGAYSLVKSAACRFCEVYGREQDIDEAVVEEVILPLLTLEETRECPPLLELKEIFRWSTIARMIIVLTYQTLL